MTHFLAASCPRTPTPCVIAGSELGPPALSAKWPPRPAVHSALALAPPERGEHRLNPALVCRANSADIHIEGALRDRAYRGACLAYEPFLDRLFPGITFVARRLLGLDVLGLELFARPPVARPVGRAERPRQIADLDHGLIPQCRSLLP